MRALLKLGGRCDSDCVFCHAGGPGATGQVSTREICRRILAARAAGCGEVVFSGGEPTVHEDLVTLARFARRAGLGFGLVTNGARLADPERRRALLELGLRYVQVSLHGPVAEVHDALSGVSSFDAAVRTITALAETDVDLGVTTVVCRPNLSALDDTVALVSQLLERPANAPRPHHRLALLEPKGRAVEQRDLVPNLSEAATRVAQALSTGRERFGVGVRRGYDGLPICLAPGPDGWLADLHAHGVALVQEVWETTLQRADAGRRAYGEPCRRCRLRPSCPGVYEGYFPIADEWLRAVE